MSSDHLGTNFLRSMSPLPMFAAKMGATKDKGSEKKLSSKDKKYVANVERALASFEYVNEWADYISFLGKLQRALHTNPEPETNHWVPHEFSISKTLARCISPKLPSGVHLKTLEVYKSIFDILGLEQMSSQVQLWIPGILPLMSYASISVKPELIQMYTSYLCKIDKNYLRTIFKPILLSLFPALDDTTSEFFDAVMTLIRQFRAQLDNEVHFWQCVFLCIITSPDKRMGAMEYCARKLPSFNAVDSNTAPTATTAKALLSQDAQNCISPEAGLLVRAFCKGLGDENLFVQRGFFDLLLSNLKLQSATFQQLTTEQDRVLLILSAAKTVLRRDMSLNRRLWNWLCGLEKEGESSSSKARLEYFQKYGLKYFLSAMSSLIEGTTSGKPVYRQNIEACRIAVAIMDRWEIGQLIIPRTLVPILRACKKVSEEDSEEHFEELMRSANTFFDGVETVTIWSDIYSLAKGDNAELILFVLRNFHVEDEDMVVNHIPLLMLALFCRKQKTAGVWLTLLKTTLDLIAQRALLPIDHASAKYVEDFGKYDDPVFVDDVIQQLDEYYSLESTTSERPFSAADLSAMYLGLVSHTASRLLNEEGSASEFYEFCAVLSQLLETVPAGTQDWEDTTLLESIRKIDLSHFREEDAPIAFGVATVFRHITKTLSKLDTLDVLKVTVSLLWQCLIFPTGRYQVEAVRSLCSLEISVDYHYVEAGIAHMFLQCNEATRLRAFNILWMQSASFNSSDSILSRPLYIILDGLNASSDSSQTYRILVAKWLQYTVTSGTLNRIFKICCGGLLVHHEFISSGKFSSTDTDDYDLFQYELTVLYNLLTVSPHDLLPVFNTELCVIDNDAELKIISDNGWTVSTYKSLAMSILRKFLSLPVPDSLSQEQFQLYCSCVRVSLNLVELLMDGSESYFGDVVSLLADTCRRADTAESDGDHVLGSCFLLAITKLMQIASKKHVKTKLFQKPATSSTGEFELLDFICNGISASKSSIQFHSWMAFVVRTAEYLSELMFTGAVSIAECVCDKIDELFALNREYLSGMQTATTLSAEVDDSICELISGLESLLARYHKFLEYLMEGESPAALPGEDGSRNSHEQGFFGSMIQGVFQVETPTEKGEVGRRRIVLLRAMKRSAVTVYKIWLWADENSKVKTAGRSTSVVSSTLTSPVAATGPIIEADTPSFLSFSRSVKYNASKLRFRAKRLLESTYLQEPMETLETLMECHQERIDPATSQYSAFKIIHVLDSSSTHATLPYIINSLVSRVNINSLDPEKQSSLVTDLTAQEVAQFLVEYTETLSSDILEDCWGDVSHLLREASLGSPNSYKKVYPDVLLFAGYTGSKLSQTSFGEQKKVKREIVDMFTKILNLSMTAKYLRPEASSLVVREDLCKALTVVSPLLPIILSDDDKCTTCFTSIVNNVAQPLAKQDSEDVHVTAVSVELLTSLSKIKAVSGLRVWKNTCWDVVNDPDFFAHTKSRDFAPILGSWIESEQEKLSEIIGKLSGSATGANAAANIFNWNDSESNVGAKNLKRIAYLLLVCDTDVFINLEPELEAKLVELFEASQASQSLKPTLFCLIRAMILKFSQVHLTTFWPVIYTELETVFNTLYNRLLEINLEDDSLGEEAKVDLKAFDHKQVLQACKLLDDLLLLGLEDFQLDEWLFVRDNCDVVFGGSNEASVLLSFVDKIAAMRNLRVIGVNGGITIDSSALESASKKRPLLGSVKKVDNVFELRPFFDKLSVYKYEGDYSTKDPDVEYMRNDLLDDLF